MIPTLPAAEAASVALWLALLLAAGRLAAPAGRLLFPGARDDGRLSGLLIGWTVAGALPWWLAAVGALDFARHAPLAAIAALAALWAVTRHRAPADPARARRGLALEAAFAGLFLLGLLQRLGAPDLEGLEKFTDMGFLAAAMQAQAMPFPDVWWGGAPVNYYYVGHAMVAAWGRLAAVPADHAYQLGMASLFALTGAAAAHAARLLLPDTRAAAPLAGFAAALVVWGGNGHAILYRLAGAWMPTTKETYRYPDSTRFIGFDPPTSDHAFTEFPAYGFYVGDLHAHLIATPLAIFALSVLAQMLRAGWGRRPVPLPLAAALGATLGLAAGINAWDVAATGLVALLTWLALALRLRGRIAPLLAPTAMVALSAAALALPFLASFESFAHGVRAVLATTPAWQLWVVYWPGVPALAALVALLATTRPDARLAMLALLAVSVAALIAIPEIVYVKDIYADDHARANTMFKLAFRSQAILQVAAVAVVGWALTRRGGRVTAALVAAPLALQLSYMADTLRVPLRPLTLDGLAFLGDERPLAAAVAAWPLAPGETFLEAPGASFTRGSRLSAMTGKPTPVGWIAHEWLWRDAKDAAIGRGTEIDLFYTTATPAERCATIARHRITAIVIAREEELRYDKTLDGAGLEALGPVIAESPAGTFRRVAPEACR